MAPSRLSQFALLAWLLQLQLCVSTPFDDVPSLCRVALEDGGGGLLLLQAQSIPLFDLHPAASNAPFANHTTDENRSLAFVQSQRQQAEDSESRADIVRGLSASSRQAVELGMRFEWRRKNSVWATRFFWNVIGLTLMVLYMTGDNAVWLLLFVAGNCTGSRNTVAGFYLLCMGLAWLVAFGLYHLVPGLGLPHLGIPPQCIAEIVSSASLAVLSYRFFRERYSHTIIVDGPKSPEEKVVEVFEEKGFECGFPLSPIQREMVVQGAERLRRKELTLPNMFLLAAASNIDTVGALVLIMVSKRYQPYELCLGVAIAASTVAGAILWASCNQKVRETMLRVPLWVIVAFFTAVVIVDTTASVSSELAETTHTS